MSGVTSNLNNFKPVMLMLHASTLDLSFQKLMFTNKYLGMHVQRIWNIYIYIDTRTYILKFYYKCLWHENIKENAIFPFIRIIVTYIFIVKYNIIQSTQATTVERLTQTLVGASWTNLWSWTDLVGCDILLTKLLKNHKFLRSKTKTKFV